VTGAPDGDLTDPERSVRAHAERIVSRDAGAREDIDPGAEIAPPDLLDRLLGGQFRTFQVVAHARIGNHHIFKTKFVGPVTLVIQARWVADAAGRWRIRDAEVTRAEGDVAAAPPLARSEP
jgi:hypothetical protein